MEIEYVVQRYLYTGGSIYGGSPKRMVYLKMNEI